MVIMRQVAVKPQTKARRLDGQVLDWRRKVDLHARQGGRRQRNEGTRRPQKCGGSRRCKVAVHVGYRTISMRPNLPTVSLPPPVTTPDVTTVPSATATLGERPKDGSPLVPWNEVFACLAAEDVAWYVVEAEAIPDSLEPLRNSRRFLREWI